MADSDIQAELDYLEAIRKIREYIDLKVVDSEVKYYLKFSNWAVSDSGYISAGSDSSDEGDYVENSGEGYSLAIEQYLAAVADNLQRVRAFIFAHEAYVKGYTLPLPDELSREKTFTAPVPSFLSLAPQSTAMAYLLGQPVIQVRDANDLMAVLHLKASGYGGVLLLPNEKALNILRDNGIDVGDYRILGAQQ